MHQYGCCGGCDWFSFRSQSKASYLAARREREHGLSTDIGSYKRTMSPSGDGAKDLDANPWPIARPQPVLAKDNTIRNNINNNNLLRRASLAESKCSSKDPLLTMVLKPCDEEKKQQCNLPDVLPVNAKAKTSPTRSHFILNGDKSVLDRERFSPPKITIQRSPSVNSPPRNSPVLDGRHRTDRDSPRSKIRESPPNSKAIRSSPIKTSPTNSPRISLQSSPLLPSPLQISPRLAYSPPTSPAKSPIKINFETNNEIANKSLSPEPKVIEGLQLIQRTEITLRVNTCTIDAASQTEKEELPCTPLPMRKKLQEEIECERLSQDLASHLSPSDRLKGILVPGPEHKKPTDYVSGLFRVDVTSKPRPLNSPFRSRNNTPTSSPPPSISPSTSSVSASVSTLDICTKTASTTTTEITVPILESTSPLSGTSAYFTTSESKAKFLTRYSRDMNQYNIVKDTKDLNQKKEELVNRLDKKLEVLRGELLVVSEEGRTNDELGENVERHVARMARPHEAAKFRLHVEEVGKITSLLLGLSGRLARAENALMGLPPEDVEKKILESKRDKLLEQLEEAKKLKESIDKRSVIVSNILYKYLNSEEYADYDHFINMKAKLIMDSREISDKIKLGEEQLSALKETLAISD